MQCCKLSYEDHAFVYSGKYLCLMNKQNDALHVMTRIADNQNNNNSAENYFHR